MGLPSNLQFFARLYTLKITAPSFEAILPTTVGALVTLGKGTDFVETIPPRPAPPSFKRQGYKCA